MRNAFIYFKQFYTPQHMNELKRILVVLLGRNTGSQSKVHIHVAVTSAPFALPATCFVSVPANMKSAISW